LDIRGHLIASNFLELVPKLPLHICSGVRRSSRSCWARRRSWLPAQLYRLC